MTDKSEISPKEFGELVQAVRELTKQVSDLNERLDKVQEEHNALVDRGKGFLAAFILLCGGGITAAIEFIRG